MKVKDKIKLEMDGLIEHGPINIVAFGDSITHGAFGFNEIDFESVYHNLLFKKIKQKSNYMPINIINAGVGGVTAVRSLDRLESQVLSHNPDLVIVCFGLNDINLDLETYLDALKQIFIKIKNIGSDLIFMTPNMLNTYVNNQVVPEKYRDYAEQMAGFQNSGRMDLYIESAVELCASLGVKVCDCYKEWKEIAKTKDTTQLLANGINHPTREMHELFANKLFETIFD